MWDLQLNIEYKLSVVWFGFFGLEIFGFGVFIYFSSFFLLVCLFVLGGLDVAGN